MERNEYENFNGPSEMVEYFEKVVLHHILMLEEALADAGARSEVYNIHLCRWDVGKPPRVEANVVLKGPKGTPVHSHSVETDV